MTRFLGAGTLSIVILVLPACGSSSDDGSGSGGNAGAATGGSSGSGSGGTGTGGGGTGGSAGAGSDAKACVNDGDTCAAGSSVTPCIVGFDCCRNVCSCTNAGRVSCQTVCDAAGGGGSCGADASLDANSACPPDFFAAEGTPCPEEGKFCGGGCTDPCQFCNVIRCQQGRWRRLEAPPDPNCNDR